MRTTISTVLTGLAVLAVALLAPPGALAQDGAEADWADKAGSFGVGGNTTLGGASGIGLRYWLSSDFGLGATVGFRYDSENDVTDPTVVPVGTQVDVGAYGMLKLAPFARAHLALLFGGDLLLVRGDAPHRTDVALGLGLMGEWFPTDRISLYAQAGLHVLIVNRDVAGIDESGVEVRLGSDLWGQAGFTVWFG